MAEKLIHEMVIHYTDRGAADQPVIVLIHGLGCSLKYWECVFHAEELRQYRILAIDLPGFGLSAKPDNYTYTLASQAEIVHALLQRLNIPRITLIGHSMGGSIAIVFALTYLNMVERLIVIEPNLKASDAHLSREIARHSEAEFIAHYEAFTQIAVKTVQHWFVNGDRSDVEEYLQELLKTTPISMYRSARSLIEVTAAETFVQQFKQVPRPKYFLTGEESLRLRGVPDDFQESSVQTIVVPGVGHMMMVDNPDVFNQTLAAVLS